MLGPGQIALLKEAIPLLVWLGQIIRDTVEGNVSEEEAERKMPVLKARKEDMMERMRDL